MALAASLLALPGLLVQPSLRPSGVVRLQRASAPAMEDEGFKMPDLPDIPNPFGGGGGGGGGGGAGGGGDGESPFAMISKMAEAGRLERLPNGGRGPKPNERFPDEAILDEGILDPVYDEAARYPYKGESKFGIVAYAERLNGRAAMVGFTALFLIELVSGKGLIELLGLQYDEGAQMAIADGGIVGFVLAWVARLIVLGAAGASVFAITKLDEAAEKQEA